MRKLDHNKDAEFVAGAIKGFNINIPPAVKVTIGIILLILSFILLLSFSITGYLKGDWAYVGSILITFLFGIGFLAIGIGQIKHLNKLKDLERELDDDF